MGSTAKVLISGLLIALVAAVSWVVAAPSQEGQREWIKSPDERLIAMVPDRDDWCQDEVTITVYGDDDALFKDDRVELQRLLGYVRATFSLDCPRATKIVMNGFVDDVFLFRGYAAKEGPQGQWILLEMPTQLVAAPPQPLPPPPLPARVPSPEAVAACDRLAAHPDDSSKPKGVAGVSDDDMRAGEAVAQCEDALELAPDNPRVRYQLARAYLMFDKVDEGITLLTEAAEEGHAAATSSLGDLALYGLLDGEPDPETAKALFLKAAAGGFKPAAGFAQAIVADPKEEKAQAESPPLLNRPNLADALTTGKPNLTTFRPLESTFAYVLKFASGMKHECPNVDFGIRGAQFLQAVSRHLGGMQAVLNYGDAINRGLFDSEQQDGMDDGYAIAAVRGCDSKEVQTASQTLIAFLRN